MINAQRSLGLTGGMLVGVPIPEQFALAEEEINGAIADAIQEMGRRGITGKAATPFLLASVVERTGGRSLEANIQLVLNNARVAADIAVAVCSRICGIRHIP
jgi:pseudouridine-5'-phosphate glycosidase